MFISTRPLVFLNLICVFRDSVTMIRNILKLLLWLTSSTKFSGKNIIKFETFKVTIFRINEITKSEVLFLMYLKFFSFWNYFSFSVCHNNPWIMNELNRMYPWIVSYFIYVNLSETNCAEWYGRDSILNSSWLIRDRFTFCHFTLMRNHSVFVLHARSLV